MLIFVSKVEGDSMHIDEQKQFDKRNIERNIKNGIITQKDYEIYLSKLPDASGKIFNPEEDSLNDSKDIESKRESESPTKKREMKKKAKGKGK
jgi:hypothetical protein